MKAVTGKAHKAKKAKAASGSVRVLFFISGILNAILLSGQIDKKTRKFLQFSAGN